MSNVIKLDFAPLSKAIHTIGKKKESLASNQVLELLGIMEEYFDLIEPGQHEGLDIAAHKVKEAAFWLSLYVEE
jgi:hypothetical protein